MSEGAFFLDEEPHSVSRRLFGLQPAGTGGERESLSSYLKRLARAHRMPLKVFALETFGQPGSGGSQVALRSDWGRCVSEYVDGVNGGAREIADWLERNTGVAGLRFCSLTSLSQFFCGQKLIAPHPQVCLHCLADDQRAGRPMFERLLWRLQPVTACDQHHCALVTPKCQGQRRRSRLAPPILPGVCPHCGSVGMACAADEAPRECSEAEFWVAQQCRRLIDAMPSLAGVDPAHMKGTLRAYLLDGPGIVAAAEEAGMMRASMSNWLTTPTSRLMLSRLLDIALTRQLDPLELLSGHIVPGLGPADRRPRTPRRTLPPVDHAAVARRLRQALESGEDAATVARDLKVSYCSIRQHEELYRQVVDQARASRTRQDTDRRLRAVQEAEQMVVKLLGQQKTPSLLNAKIESGEKWMPSSLKAEALACIRVRLGHAGVQLPARAPLYSAELTKMLDESAARIRQHFV